MRKGDGQEDSRRLKSRAVPAIRLSSSLQRRESRFANWVGNQSFPKLEDIVATAWAWHQKHPNGYPD